MTQFTYQLTSIPTLHDCPHGYSLPALLQVDPRLLDLWFFHIPRSPAFSFKTAGSPWYGILPRPLNYETLPHCWPSPLEESLSHQNPNWIFRPYELLDLPRREGLTDSLPLYQGTLWLKPWLHCHPCVFPRLICYFAVGKINYSLSLLFSISECITHRQVLMCHPTSEALIMLSWHENELELNIWLEILI